ncbi:MAG: glycoside hydrolase family 25 protein [Niastella sp.]|nr:glycoside hydrolase family 25 protein [Niastella sp.]
MPRKKKKFKPIRSVLLFFSIALAASVIIYFGVRYFNEPASVLYPEFGISLPTGYGIHGIDVSRYQKNISWQQVREMKIRGISIDFAFIKATEGTDRVDEKFGRNWVFAEKNNMVKGAYHYFSPGKDGKKQALNFLETVKLKKGDLPPVLDIEELNAVSIPLMQQRVQDWLLLVEKEYKVKPILYSNVDFYNRYLSGKFSDYPLWVAHYLQKEKPRIGRNWLFWQHNERGQVNGIRSYVDFNVYNGDSISFERLKLK